jgi:hypothetical protein
MDDSGVPFSSFALVCLIGIACAPALSVLANVVCLIDVVVVALRLALAHLFLIISLFKAIKYSKLLVTIYWCVHTPATPHGIQVCELDLRRQSHHAFKQYRHNARHCEH